MTRAVSEGAMTLRKTLSYYKTMLNPRVPLHRNEPHPPFFIVGSGRSGNTLLRRILFNDPEVYIPPETYVMGRTIRNFEKVAKAEWGNLVRTVLAEFAFSEDARFFPTQNFRPVYQTLLKLPPPERSYARIVHELFMFLALEVKPTATRWGDKTPLNVFALDDIYRAFPQARYVHLMRNGYDVTASYLKMGRYTQASDAARRWKNANAACTRFAQNHRDQVIDVKYEDLALHPERVVPEICDHLGMTYSPRLLDAPEDIDKLGDMSTPHYQQVSQKISGHNISKGFESLSEAQLAEIRDIIEPGHRQYGYAALQTP